MKHIVFVVLILSAAFCHACPDEKKDNNCVKVGGNLYCDCVYKGSRRLEGFLSPPYAYIYECNGVTEEVGKFTHRNLKEVFK